jgi:hypothetical protein
VYGAQLAKAVEARLALAPRLGPLLELALGVAWLASGRRARQAIAKQPGFPGEHDLAARVDAMAEAIGL